MAHAPVSTPPRTGDRLAPGLAMVALGVASAWVLNRLFPSVSVLMFALLLGAVVTNIGVAPAASRAGVRFASKRLLRAGIVLLGLQLSISDMLGLGWSVLAVVLITVAFTFAVTLWLSARLGVSPGRALLIATGVSICGASAVTAMSAVADADEEDVMSTVTLITLYGTAAIVVLPLLAGGLGLAPDAFGIWAGASVHEVAQVVATASAVGAGALAPAVAVKLTRVVLLAPLIAAVTLWQRRRVQKPHAEVARPPLVPLFVAGFLAAMCLRSTNLLPTSVLDYAKVGQTALLGAGMFGLGASVRLRSLLRASGRGLVAGLLATLAITAVSLSGILIIS